MKKSIYMLILIMAILTSCSQNTEKQINTNEKAIQSSMKAQGDSKEKLVSEVSDSMQTDILSTSEKKNEETINSNSSSLNSISTQNDIQKEQHVVNAESKNVAEIEAIYKNLHIGEVVETGYIYIEPFRIERNTYNEKINFSNYPKLIKFYPFSSRENCLSAKFDSLFSTYVPIIEEKSRYFLQSFSEPDQYGLRYKLQNKQSVTQIGVSLFGYEIKQKTIIEKDKKRPYSQSEYKKALSLIEEDKKIDKSDRTLEYISLENTIVGANQICLISIKDTQFDILISKFITHGFEYVADVYVADFIKDGKVIKTYEKYNWDGPY